MPKTDKPAEMATEPSRIQPAELPEPRAGGNYLRDPVTGALTSNPNHESPQE